MATCSVCNQRQAEFVVWEDRQAYERIQTARRAEACGNCASEVGGDRVSPFAFIRKSEVAQVGRP